MVGLYNFIIDAGQSGQISQLIEHVEKQQKQIDELKENVEALSKWVLHLKEQYEILDNRIPR